MDLWGSPPTEQDYIRIIQMYESALNEANRRIVGCDDIVNPPESSGRFFIPFG